MSKRGVRIRRESVLGTFGANGGADRKVREEWGGEYWF
jgi:hypothetical protein